MKENWGPIKSQPDDDLKQVAKDIYNNKIFTDRHCSPGNLMTTFMVLMFMGPQEPSAPKYPSENKDLQGRRDNVIYDVIDRENERKIYEQEMIQYNLEKEYYNKNRVPSIGLVYEYMDKASSIAINGQPSFFSLRLLNKSDADKVFEYYDRYKEIREKVDNF